MSLILQMTRHRFFYLKPPKLRLLYKAFDYFLLSEVNLEKNRSIFGYQQEKKLTKKKSDIVQNNLRKVAFCDLMYTKLYI